MLRSSKDCREMWLARKERKLLSHGQASVPGLVNLLLLVEADLAGAHVDEKEEATDDGEDLEEVVLGEVLVGVVLVEL